MSEGTAVPHKVVNVELVAAIRQLNATLQDYLPDVITGKEDGTTSIASVEQLYTAHKELREGVKVYVHTVFLKVGEIDTIKENFSANVFVHSKWREPSLDKYPKNAIDNIDWTKMWTPKLYIENLVGDPKETIWHTVTFDDQGQATAYEKRRVKGVFTESMELKQFPFDTQDLTVSVASELLENEVYLEEDRSEVSTVNTQSFIDEQEWSLQSNVKVVRRTLTSEFDNIRRKPIISSSCRAKRRPGFFIWNVLLVMLFICSLAFATFSVSLGKPQNRLQLSFTLILTTVAFKFVVGRSLPKISYLTLLDKYILISMGILIAICIWHAIIPIIMVSHPSGRDNTTLSLVTKINHDVASIAEADLKLVLALDKYAVYVLVAVHVLFHIIFFTIIIVEEKSGDEQKFTILESEDMKNVGMSKAKVAPIAEEVIICTAAADSGI